MDESEPVKEVLGAVPIPEVPFVLGWDELTCGFGPPRLPERAHHLLRGLWYFTGGHKRLPCDVAPNCHGLGFAEARKGDRLSPEAYFEFAPNLLSLGVDLAGGHSAKGWWDAPNIRTLSMLSGKGVPRPEAPESLRYLWLGRYKLESLEGLPRGLDYLELRRCRNLTPVFQSLGAGALELRTLYVCGDQTMTDISWIERFPTLEEVCFEHMKHVEDYSPLLNLPRLRRLALNRVSKASYARALTVAKEMPLEQWAVSGGSASTPGEGSTVSSDDGEALVSRFGQAGWARWAPFPLDEHGLGPSQAFGPRVGVR